MRLISPAAAVAAAILAATATWVPVAGVARAAGPDRIAKGPYLTGLSDTGITVRFELAQPAAARVEVTAAGAAGGDAAAPIVFDSPASSMHLVALGGLEPAKRYAYVVRVGGAVLGAGHWTQAPRTSPASRTPQTFLVYGDDRTDDAAHADVVRAMMQVPADFLVNTGDVVADGGSAEDWQTFFDIERPLLVNHAIFSAIGNHELYDDAAGARFGAYLGFPRAGEKGDARDAPDGAARAVTPYGTVRVGNARFFFLNGMHDWTSGDERAWLERELVRADGEAGLVWRFAVVHHGPWSSGPHGGNTKLLAAQIPELLTAHGVDLLFAGHDHVYERGAGRLAGGTGPGGERTLKYVISGGGGAPLYHIDSPTPFTLRSESAHHFVEVTTTADAVRLVVHRSDGSLLERCGFAKGAAWDCDPVDAKPRPASSPVAPGAAGVFGADAPPPESPSSRSFCAAAAPGPLGSQDAGFGGALVVLAAATAGAARRRRPG